MEASAEPLDVSKVCKIAGDEMFADSYPMREIQDGFFYEVDGKVGVAVSLSFTPFMQH